MSCRVSTDYVAFNSYVLHLSHLIATLGARLSTINNSFVFGSNSSLSAKMISLFSLTLSVFSACLLRAKPLGAHGVPKISFGRGFWVQHVYRSAKRRRCDMRVPHRGR